MLKVAWSVPQPVWSNRVDDLTAPMLSAMNVRYAIVRASLTLPQSWTVRYRDAAYAIAENRRALPRARDSHAFVEHRPSPSFHRAMPRDRIRSIS